MTDRASVDAWVARYVQAWISNEPADIAALFTADAIYRPTPHSEGWHGREAIVEGWLARKDDPGTWSFEHEVLAADGEVGIVQGRTIYTTDPPYDFSNLWVLRLTPDGLCRHYVEWWIERKTPDPGEPAGA